MKKRIGLALIAVLTLTVCPAVQAQGPVPPPKVGPSTVGDDYFVANYTQLLDYWNQLDKLSERMKIVEIGKTAEGRPMVMAIITSPENHKKLARYKEISHRLGRAEGITEPQARALASEGKAVVWEDGGLHATEILNSQVLFWQAYQMVSQNDAETLRFLNDVILLLVPVNPDGLELTANWYMRDPDPKQRNMQLPRLYHKYVGHDNNRDSFMANQPETEAINRQMYIEWMPQITYNAHQTGPQGAILFVPPFRDPFNYNLDPLVIIGIDEVGAAITSRFLAEGKAGSASRSEASYSTWANGLERATSLFHNQVGILTEAHGHPTPMEIPLVLDRQLPHGDVPLPIPPQRVWHFKQSIDYILSAQRAILDVASRNKDQWLFRSWRMGMNSIERGSKDHWTLQPTWIDEAKAAAAKEATAERSQREGETRVGSAQVVPSKYYDSMRTPERRDPRAYIIPADQPDFLTATKFVNMLVKAGIEVHRARSAFQVAGKSYAAGSYVLKAAQAYRPHLRDMLEPQNHPNDFYYPGGPPKPPYDMAGYTLAFQMGVQFDRILDPLEGSFEKLPFGQLIKIPAGSVVAGAGESPAGYLLSHAVKDAFTATNRLLGAKEDVYWLKAGTTVGGKSYPPGTIYIPSRPTTRAAIDKLAAEIGLTFEGTARPPTGEAYKLQPVRVGLVDQYGGSMPSGWVRWLFEQQFQFPTFEVVYPPQLDAGNLRARYDVIVFMDGVPRTDREPPRRGESAPPSNLPPEWAGKVGTVTVAKTIPQLRTFVEDGGTIIAAGTATNLAYHLGLPVADHLVERTATGQERPLPSEKYFVPGALVKARVDNTNPLAYGMPDQVDVFFNRSPVFRLAPTATSRDVKVVAWYSAEAPVRSGWGWGQGYLKDGAAALEIPLGKGKVFLFGPEITFRGGTHATFPFLFNGIYYGAARSVEVPQAGRQTTSATR
ncbi:MAG TPA: M14 metallopeptidase family protein [Vicinamibacterales bacterium]|nr:M14 metallopeptidase family protein [Vicinamibacterales bacterium]